MNRFATRALALGLLLAAADYWPLAVGHVPFPADVILNFPPWQALRGGPLLETRHAEMADLATQVYPWRQFLHDSVRRGELPLWNPHVLFGFPFVANAQSGVFYPLHWLHVLLPVPVSWALLFPLRMLLAFTFTALLARRLGASPTGACVGAVAFACGGFMVAWQGWAHAESALWLPAVLLAVERLRGDASPRSTALLAACFALPVLAGHPEVAVYAAGAGAAFGLYRLWCPALDVTPAGRGRFALALVSGAALGLGLTCVQLLPTLEWLRDLARPAQGFIWPPMPVEKALSLLSRDAASNPNSAGFDVPEMATYAGFLTLIAAPVALAHGRRREVWFFVLLLACAFQLAYGSGPVYRLAVLVPVLGALPHDRAVLLVDFSLALLAAFGVSAIEEHPRRERPAVPGLLLSSIACCGWALWVLSTRVLAERSEAWEGWNGLASSWIVFGAAAVALLAALLRGWPAPACAALLLLVQGGDLVGYSYGHVPFVEGRWLYPEPAVYTRLKQLDPGPFRIASLDNTAPLNVEMMFGLASPGGQEYVTRPVARRLLPLTGDDPSVFIPGGLRAERIVAQGDRRLDLMNVKYLLATTDNESAALLADRPERFRLIYEEEAIRLFENRRVLPRAFLVPAAGVEVLADDGAVDARLASSAFDPARLAIVASEPSWPPGERRPAGPSRVLRVEPGFNTSTIETEAGEPSLLVMSDLYYPGWRAAVDGRPAPLLLTDGLFRGVALGPGRHLVHFRYQPGSFRLGIALSLSALATCLVMAWRRRGPAAVSCP